VASYTALRKTELYIQASKACVLQIKLYEVSIDKTETAPVFGTKMEVLWSTAFLLFTGSFTSSSTIISVKR
jgi:hypothetical protein